jgi:hypothetical protein
VNSVVGSATYNVEVVGVGCNYVLELVASAANEVKLYEVTQSINCVSENITLVHSGSGIAASVYRPQAGGGQVLEWYGMLAKSAA